MMANNGDYIVKGIEDEVYPVKASIFEKTYMPDTIHKNNVFMAFLDTDDRN